MTAEDKEGVGSLRFPGLRGGQVPKDKQELAGGTGGRSEMLPSGNQGASVVTQAAGCRK